MATANFLSILYNLVSTGLKPFFMTGTAISGTPAKYSIANPNKFGLVSQAKSIFSLFNFFINPQKLFSQTIYSLTSELPSRSSLFVLLPITKTLTFGYFSFIALNIGVAQTISPSFAVCITRMFFGFFIFLFALPETKNLAKQRKKIKRLFILRGILFKNLISSPLIRAHQPFSYSWNIKTAPPTSV